MFDDIVKKLVEVIDNSGDTMGRNGEYISDDLLNILNDIQTLQDIHKTVDIFKNS